LQALNTKLIPRTGEQLFKDYADLFLIGLSQKGELAENEILLFSIPENGNKMLSINGAQKK
tara:strand:- start:395 stop:577 length:183 start_codon:yes stop_codon:yes gene_type:complete